MPRRKKDLLQENATDKAASNPLVERNSDAKADATLRKGGPRIQPRKKRAAQHFPIVGIGASAGGLEAFTELLKHLPSDSGLGFVLVQHLDPQHESALTQLLARASSMPVCEVVNNLRVEANHVYVIPPNTSLGIAHGVLKLRPRPPGRTPTRSIDTFFESLAQDQRERAIGVVLSGTATDGTLGLEAIKAEGGVTFAQDDSAKYNSMPRNAVAAGCVDFVLSPENIARELARIAKHPYVAGRPPDLLTPSEDGKDLDAPGGDAPLPARGRSRAPAKSRAAEAEAKPAGGHEQNGYKRILVLLRNHCGVDFSLYKPSTIHRRITRRMVLNKQETLEHYGAFLRANAKELDALYSDVLIGVTSFFRNPEAFDVLKRKVFPKLLHQRRHEPLRVWVLGCSTGQEAYSIAMAFAESAEESPRARKLQVFATDLNDAMLDKARQGLYAKNLDQDVSPERLRRFFVEEDGGYRILKSLRESVVFARQNLISDPPFSRMDLISCRNLMIYLEPSLQKKALPTFHYALKPEGFLFLGASESIGNFTDLFEPVDKKQRIYSRKAAPTQMFHLPVKVQREEQASRAPSRQAAAPLPTGDAPGEAPQGFRGELNAQREADRVTVNQFAPPGVLINAELQILQFRGPTGAYLEPPPSGKPSFDVLKMAREGLMLPLRAAIKKANKENKTARREKVAVKENGRTRTVNIEVVPLKNLRERCFLVLFEDSEKAGRPAASREQPSGALKMPRAADKKEPSRRVASLERDLSETRDYLQSIQEQHEAANEELQASNEEVQSANEELQSTNEELETSKEELESTNEELTTINEEMANRNTELNRLNSDLTNLQTSTKLVIVLLARDLTIRRFSVQAEKEFNLLAADLGRPITGIRHNLNVPDLEKLIAEVIASVRECEREVQNKDGRWFSLRVRPYLTVENKVDGAVLVLVDNDALKRAEQEAKVAHAYAQGVIEDAPPLLILDSRLRVISGNRSFYKHFKVFPVRTENILIYELGNGQWNIPKLRIFLEEVLPRRSFFKDFEVIHEFETIGRRTMLLSGHQLDHAQQILLFIDDVTERIESQERVRASELRYRRLFESAHNGVLILDSVSRKITDANPFMTELLGYTGQELLGKELWQIGMLKDEPASQAAFRELQRKRVIRYEDLPLQAKSGDKRAVEVVANLYEEGGKQVVQCNIRDITERKQADAALHASEERYRTLFDLGTVAVYSCDADGVIRESNRRAAELWGRQPALGDTDERFCGSFRLISPNGTVMPHTDCPMAEVLSGKIPEARDAEVIIERPDASRITVVVNIHPLKNSAGQITGAINCFYDITERKRMEEALQLAQRQLADRAGHLEQAVTERTAELVITNKQMEAFIYSIAHDLRAPLRAMQGFSAMLVEEAGTALSEMSQSYARRIDKASQFMDALLRDLLDFSRVSQQRLELAPVGLGTIVETILSRLEEGILEKNARVENSGPWPFVRAHEPTLAQVLFNLISNALKFVTPDAAPVVRLRTEERSEFIRVWVEDKGIGIAPDYQDQVFRLFARLHGEKYPGTGVGLAIVQKGVERMGGRVGVESAPAQGSRFWFELKKAETVSRDTGELLFKT
jgi:two-component system CheB/CheR fusion protein